MSWTEVKKINGDLTKPLDTLITEQNAALESTLASKSDVLSAMNSTILAVERGNEALTTLDTPLDKLIMQRGQHFICGHHENNLYLSNLSQETWITLGEVSGLGFITHGFNYVCLKSLSENNRGMYVRGRILVDDVVKDYWTVQTITSKSQFINEWSLSMPKTGTERREMDPILSGIGGSTVYWTDINPVMWFENLKVQVYWYHDSRDQPTTSDYIYRCYFEGIKLT